MIIFPKKIESKSTFLITGGLGGIAIHLAEKLLTEFASKIILCGRTDVNKLNAAQFNRLELLKEKYQRKIIKLTLILVLFFLGIQYTINPKLFFEFNLFEIFITSFSIIIFSAFHFYNMLNEKKEFYYINMGILLYLFGSTILFLVGNLTITLSREFTKIPWILNALFYVFYQLFVLFEWKKSFFKKELEPNL